MGDCIPMTDDETEISGAEQIEAPEAPRRKFAKEVNVEAVFDPMVRVRVLKRGADRISTGRHEPILGDEYYAHGEQFDVPESVARDLEARDFVEVIG